MNDQDYIRAAVELVSDDWFVKNWNYDITDTDIDQYDLDALVAQLVRQVDATPISDKRPFHRHSVIERPLSTIIYSKDGYENGIGTSEPNSRTMNTLKAVVDSKVLEK